MGDIFNNPDIFINFINQEDDEGFHIDGMGYNNFAYLAPCMFFRVQRMYTLHFVMSGSGTLEIYGKTIKVKQYDMFFIPPSVSMRYYPDTDNLWQYCWLELSGSKLPSFASKMGFADQAPVIHCDKYNIAVKETQNIFRSYDNGHTVGYYSAAAMFFKLMDAVITPQSEERETLYNQILAYISARFHNSALKIEDICRDFNISHSYICKIFKNNGGVKKILTETRINEAKSLLVNTDLNISEIGFSVGFNDNIHFMKVFKAYTGMTAKEYRNRYSKSTE